MDLYTKLKLQFKENVPISIYEIQNILSKYSRIRVFQLINELIKSKKLVRFEKGLYYLPSQTIFGASLLSSQKVIEKKYIKNDSDIFGFSTGLSFQNEINLSTQVPNIIEIYTNKESSRVREICVGNLKVRLRKARTEINSKNFKQLQFLELLNQLKKDEIGNNKSLLIDYMIKNNINLENVKKYIDYYPAKVFKNFLWLGFANE